MTEKLQKKILRGHNLSKGQKASSIIDFFYQT